MMPSREAFFDIDFVVGIAQQSNHSKINKLIAIFLFESSYETTSFIWLHQSSKHKYQKIAR